MSASPDIVVLGLSLSSSWGNGHATTYRSLLRGLAQEGREVLFLERATSPGTPPTATCPNPTSACWNITATSRTCAASCRP